MRRGLLLMRPSSEVRDGFDDRTTTGLLGHTPTGRRPWRVYQQTEFFDWGTTAGKAYTPAGNTHRAVVDTGMGDCSVQATFSTGAASNILRISGRIWGLATNRQNEIFVNAGTTTWTLQKRDAGSATTLGTYAAAPADGDVVRLQMRGDQLEVFINGTSRIGPVKEPLGMGATEQCMSILSSTTGRIDDFSVTRV